MQDYKIKKETKLYLTCRQCGKSHQLKSLDENLFCKCGSQLIERSTAQSTIQNCTISGKEIVLKP